MALTQHQQYIADPKGHSSFTSYCREFVDRKPTVEEAQAILYIRGKAVVWRIDARGTLPEMLARGEERSKKQYCGMYRYSVKVVVNGNVVKRWDRDRP